MANKSQYQAWRFFAAEQLNKDDFNYEVRSQRWYHRQIVFGFLATIGSALLYYYGVQPTILETFDLDTKWANLHPALLPSLGGGIVFMAATFIGLLMSQAVNRYFSLGKALSEIEGAVQGITLNLNGVGDIDLRDKLFRTLRRILRAMCAQAIKKPFTIIVDGPNGKREFQNSLTPLLEIFRQLLEQAEIASVVIGNNGRIHVLNPAGAMVELTVKILLPVSLYYATAALVLILYLAFATFIALFGGNASTIIGTTFSGVVGGAVTLMIFVARNRAMPFGRKPSDYRPRTFYRDLETGIDQAIATRDLMTPAKKPQVQD